MSEQSVIIIDDHRLFAEGLRSLLTLQGVEVTHILHDSRLLLPVLEERAPRLLLMDIAMEGMDGVDLSALVKKKYPDIKILIISMHAKRIYIEKLLRTGIEGYLLKNAGDEELKTAVATILGGGNYFSAALRDIVLKCLLPSSGPDDAVLTPREKDILQLIGEGYSTKEISARLYVSINTIETHRKNMLLKTGLRNVAHLVKWAFENGQI